jgi:hypothetical protein
MTKIIAAILGTALLASCADPAFDNYVASRQAAIAGMPNGPARYQAQMILDQQIYADKRRQEAQAQNAAMAIAGGLAAGAAAANAYNYNNYYNPYYYRRPIVIYP